MVLAAEDRGMKTGKRVCPNSALFYWPTPAAAITAHAVVQKQQLLAFVHRGLHVGGHARSAGRSVMDGIFLSNARRRMGGQLGHGADMDLD